MITIAATQPHGRVVSSACTASGKCCGEKLFQTGTILFPRKKYGQVNYRKIAGKIYDVKDLLSAVDLVSYEANDKLQCIRC
jgi:hypothetical protein